MGSIERYYAREAGGWINAFVQLVALIFAVALLVGLVVVLAIGFLAAYAFTFAVQVFDHGRGKAMRSRVTASWHKTRLKPAQVRGRGRTTNRTVVVQASTASRRSQTPLQPAPPPPVAPARIAAPLAPDIPSQIRKLHDLKTQGILTEAEFDAKKKQLLARM